MKNWTKKVFNLHVLSILFNLINLLLFTSIAIASIFGILEGELNLIIINSFTFLTSLVLVISEIHLNKIIIEYFKFICTFIGKGFLFLLLGLSVWRPNTLNVIVTYSTTIIGILYIISFYILKLIPINDLINNFKSYRAFNEEVNSGVYSQEYKMDINEKLVFSQYNKNDHKIEFKDQAALAMEINDALAGDYIYELTNKSRSSPNIPQVAHLTKEITPQLNEIRDLNIGLNSRGNSQYLNSRNNSQKLMFNRNNSQDLMKSKNLSGNLIAGRNNSQNINRNNSRNVGSRVNSQKNATIRINNLPI